ncbi:MAG: DNA translocase FtsK 4TM domain-containing protein, partial [Gemmatimonadota bacterium]|nr:DNA translocase FtsK 4TM domain-containing protein [Gemmatimonadota bacterium]
MGSTTLRRELAGIALLLFALFLGAAIAFPGADGASCAAARGATGPVGACLRSLLVATLGIPATVLLPLLPLVYALRVFRRIEADTDRSWLLFLGGVVLILPVAIALAGGAGREVTSNTGIWGSFAAFYLQRAFGFAGAWIVVVLLFSALTAVTLAWNPVRVLIGWKPKPSALVLDQKPSKAKRRWPIAEDNAVSNESAAVALAPTPEEMPGVDPTLPGAFEKNEERGTRKKKRSKAEIAAERDEKIAAVIDASAIVPEVAADELPPVDILAPPPARNRESSQRELDAMGVKLMEALRTFRVEGELVGRTTGPVVTQFEVEPAPGVKVRQIANLSNDLALAMRAQSIRVVAPIPGRGAVGVEVPNPVAEIVSFREILESKDFQQARAALPIALGKDLEGKPVIADLAKMPHLLIAGATGSGKSVCVNTLITSLVYRHTPKTLRFLMVDPKM